jgi:GxxExxY protein
MDSRQTGNTRQNEFLYGQLTYELNGIFFKVNEEIGFGQTEKIYCDAIAKLLEKHEIKFRREVYCPIKIDGEFIAKRYFDFLIEDKIIIEVKIGDYKYKEACSQLFGYLKSSDYKLGIIVRFTKNGVKLKRIPHLY